MKWIEDIKKIFGLEKEKDITEYRGAVSGGSKEAPELEMNLEYDPTEVNTNKCGGDMSIKKCSEETIKKVKDLEEGDVVKTDLGRWRKIENITPRAYSSEIEVYFEERGTVVRWHDQKEVVIKEQSEESQAEHEFQMGDRIRAKQDGKQFGGCLGTIVGANSKTCLFEVEYDSKNEYEISTVWQDPSRLIFVDQKKNQREEEEMTTIQDVLDKGFDTFITQDPRPKIEMSTKMHIIKVGDDHVWAHPDDDHATAYKMRESKEVEFCDDCKNALKMADFEDKIEKLITESVQRYSATTDKQAKRYDRNIASIKTQLIEMYEEELDD